MTSTFGNNPSTVRRESAATTVNIAPSRRESSTTRRQASFSNEDRRNYVKQSKNDVRPMRRSSNTGAEMSKLAFPGTETIEDFSARIIQEQQIRFQTKRQLLKLMLSEADIDTEMLMSQDLALKLTKPEGGDGEESFREVPPPPPSPHPLDRTALHASRVMASLDTTLEESYPSPRQAMNKASGKSRPRKSQSLILHEPHQAHHEQEYKREERQSGYSDIPEWVAVDLGQYKGNVDAKAGSLSSSSSSSSSGSGSGSSSSSSSSISSNSRDSRDRKMRKQSNVKSTGNRGGSRSSGSRSSGSSSSSSSSSSSG